MSSKIEQICTAFDRIAELGIVLGVSPLNKIDGCWECQIDEHWWIAVNGHKTAIKTSDGIKVEPYTCFVKFNGWPAGVFDPVNGGVIAAGTLANEDAFIKAIEEKIATK